MRRDDDPNPIRVPAKLASEWREKLKRSGFRDIEYTDGSILGISHQEVERAPDEVEIDTTKEYYSQAVEYLAARCWKKQQRDKRIWKLHSEAVDLRDISKRLGVPLTTVHRVKERLRVDCAAWWAATAEERANPPPSLGRPRKENPRREQLLIRLTRDEMIAIRSAAQRAGASSCHEAGSWIRAALLTAAVSVPYVPRKIA